MEKKSVQDLKTAILEILEKNGDNLALPNKLPQHQANLPQLSEIVDQLQLLVANRVRHLSRDASLPLVSTRHTNSHRNNDPSQPAWERIGEARTGSNATKKSAASNPAAYDVFGPADLFAAVTGLLPQDTWSTPLRFTHLMVPPKTGALFTAIVSPASSVLSGIKAPNLSELRSLMPELNPLERHIGIDDMVSPTYTDSRVLAAREALVLRTPRAAMKFARRGVPASCRSQIWESALSLSKLSHSEAEAFDLLCSEALEQNLLADQIIEADLQTITDSEHFFLFEEQIRAVVLAFSRDVTVATLTAHAAFPRLHVSSSTGGQQHVYPPNGVVPFTGLSLLVAPLCYLYDDPAEIYRLFRVMYCRYWMKLHTLGDLDLISPGFPVLCRVFEDVVKALDPKLVAHLERLGIPPLRIGIPWITLAFVGWLPVDQVLLLWDRMLGYDSLLPIPLLAASLLVFRRHILLSCTSGADVLDVMSDISQVKVVPLLQTVLHQASA